MSSTRRFLLFAVLLALSAAHNAGAQTTTGGFSGNVVDDSGLVLPGATVTILQEETGALRNTVTNEVGAFNFAAVQPGPYTVRIELPGFSTYELTGAQLATNQQYNVGTVELSIATLQETVQVTAQRIVETISSDRSALITEETIDAITVRGRDVTSMLRILPGVGYQPDPDAIGEIVIGSWLPNVGGTRQGWSTVTIDGIPGNDIGLPEVSSHSMNPDAVGEVNVQLTNFTADTGRNGGAQINLVTKAGTNDFSGTAYTYGRSEQFRSEDYFDKQAGIPKPEYRYWTLGANAGGPIVQDKVFFFYSYEQWGVRTPQNLAQLTVPSLAERMGDFSQSFDQSGNLIPVIDPLTGMPFPGNVVPADRINPHGQALLNWYPDPNVDGQSNYNYQFQGQQRAPRINNVTRVDVRPTANDAIYARFSHWLQPTSSWRGGWEMLERTFTYNDFAVATNYTRVIGDNMVNEFNFGWRHSSEHNPWASSFDINRNRRTDSHTAFPGDDGRDNGGDGSNTQGVVPYTLAQWYPTNNLYGIIPAMSFGAPIPNAANPSWDSRFINYGNDDLFNFYNGLSWTSGRHNFKVGAYVEHLTNIEGKGASALAGRYDFNRDPANPFGTGHPYANALIGAFRSYQENTARLGQLASQWIGNVFVQDKWQPVDRLTLDIGMRFSKYTVFEQANPSASFLPSRFDHANAAQLYMPTMVNGVRMAMNPNDPSDIRPEVVIGALVPGSPRDNGMVRHDDPQVPAPFQDLPTVLLEPRIGFAYDLFGNGRTALRANFGVFHNTQQAGALSWRQALNPPLVATPQVWYNTMYNWETIRQGVLAGTGGIVYPTGTVYGVVTDHRAPTLYSYTAGVQTEIGWQTVLDIAYVGTRATNLPQLWDENTIERGARFLPQNQDPTTGLPLPDNFMRPYPGYASIIMTENAGRSQYNALQTQVNRRFTGGLEFSVSYTLSQSKDHTSADILYGARSRVPKYENRDTWSWGLSDFDRTHLLTINYTWDLPDPGGAAGFLLDDWVLSGITQMVSGAPAMVAFSTTDNQDILGGGDLMRRSTNPDGLASIDLVVPANIDRSCDLSAGGGTIDRWFNTDCFSRPAQGEVGNVRKDDLRLPGFYDTGVRLGKRMPVGNGQFFELGWEIYNLFNQVQFRNVDLNAQFDEAGNQVDSRFGQVISARPPRTMVFSARYLW